MFNFYILQVSPRFQQCGIIKSQDSITERSGKITATLASLNDDLGDILKRFHHVFRLFHMDEADRCRDDTSRTSLALTDEVTELHQCCGSITKSEKSIWVFFYGKTDTCLCAGYSIRTRQLCYTRVAEITLCLNTQSF